MLALKNSRMLLVHAFILYCCLLLFVCRSWPTVPQVFVKGEFVGGCDILLAMHRSGELEEFLVKQGIVQPQEQDQESKQAD